jgi:hypothetical protein
MMKIIIEFEMVRVKCTAQDDKWMNVSCCGQGASRRTSSIVGTGWRKCSDKSPTGGVKGFGKQRQSRTQRIHVFGEELAKKARAWAIKEAVSKTWTYVRFHFVPSGRFRPSANSSQRMLFFHSDGGSANLPEITSI